MFNKAIILFTLYAFPFPRLAVSQVTVGADRLLSDEFRLIRGKRIGLVTNHTALLRNGVHLADSLARHSDVRLVALFGPEHGVRGEAAAGAVVDDTVDVRTGAHIYSLYGRTYKPTPEMLSGVEVLLYDVQDVGTRFYSYISTMTYAMEAAAEAGIPFIVLDRPNPLTGSRVEGFVLDDSLKSFVGLYPIPIVYGMTPGELAAMINGEGWLRNGVRGDLTVVRMSGWTRTMWYDQTGLPWLPPSPNMRTLETAIVYPGSCLLEGTNLSEGRGTDRPFENVGAPFIDGKCWAEELNALKLPGVRFDAITFRPNASKHAGSECGGVKISVIDRKEFQPVKTGLALLSTARRLYPSDFQWYRRSIDRLAGSVLVRTMIETGERSDRILDLHAKRVEEFVRRRTSYLTY
ncbi:MAG: DUF1343 domain-containing protein [Ignavibacteriales bacterium]|nr:DUF1343 domain-containing protein [Ignavibacteriales bacterium]